MIKIDIFRYFSIKSYVRCKSEITFVRRCFHDAEQAICVSLVGNGHRHEKNCFSCKGADQLRQYVHFRYIV